MLFRQSVRTTLRPRSTFASSATRIVIVTRTATVKLSLSCQTIWGYLQGCYLISLLFLHSRNPIPFIGGKIRRFYITKGRFTVRTNIPFLPARFPHLPTSRTNCVTKKANGGCCQSCPLSHESYEKQGRKSNARGPIPPYPMSLIPSPRHNGKFGPYKSQRNDRRVEKMFRGNRKSGTRNCCLWNRFLCQSSDVILNNT
jgi:hypothetical protein